MGRYGADVTFLRPFSVFRAVRDGAEAQLALDVLKAARALYGTFRLNFHRFDRFELDLRGHTQP